MLLFLYSRRNIYFNNMLSSAVLSVNLLHMIGAFEFHMVNNYNEYFLFVINVITIVLLLTSCSDIFHAVCFCQADQVFHPGIRRYLINNL